MKTIYFLFIFCLFGQMSIGQDISNDFNQVQSITISKGDTLHNSWDTDFTYLLYGNRLFLIEDDFSTQHKVLDCIIANGSSTLILENGIVTIYHFKGLDTSLDVVEYRWSYQVNGTLVQFVNIYRKI